MPDIKPETTSSLPESYNNELTIVHPIGIGEISIEPIPKILGKEFADLAPQIILASLDGQPDLLRKQETRILLRRNIADRPGLQTAGLLIDHGNSRGVIININSIEEIEEASMLLNAKNIIAPPIVQSLFVLGHEINEQVWRYKQTHSGIHIDTVKVQSSDDLTAYNATLHEQNGDKGALNALEIVLGIKYKLDPESKVVLY